jgi:NAD(P)-dependent dehydrogenase (short-subunit alcohol dehydrogenase family)
MTALREDWDTLFAVTMKGTFLCYKYAAQQMIKQGRGGRIIGASSLSREQGECRVTCELELTDWAYRIQKHASVSV